MSTTTPDGKRAVDVDPTKTARFLANLQRTVAKRDPDDPTTPTTTTTASAPDTPAEPVQKPRAKPAKRPNPRPVNDERVSMELRLDPGTGKRVVYVRVDKTLADRLQLIAFQNKMTGGDGPTTINDIGIEALLDWIDRYESRQAA
jgi:hypothetical protein